MGSDHDSAVHVELAELARGLHSHISQGTDDVLRTITDEAVAVLGGARCAGVSLISRKKQVKTAGATNADAVEFDRLQGLNGDGPCMEAAWQNDIVVVDDLPSDTRWPRLRDATLERTAIRGSVSYKLFTSEHGIGALNIYADRPHAFSDSDIKVGYAYATHASIVLDAAQRQQQFSSALASRDVIGQAKGVIMERFDLGPTKAFELLQKLSQDSNTPVAELARRLVNVDHPD